MANWYTRLTQKRVKNSDNSNSWLRKVVTGSLYRISDMRGQSSLSDIRTQIDTMRALARDSQISTALSYYATDATTCNSAGQIIWATPVDPTYKEAADIINTKLKQWKINEYARDHILELATVGNLYIPTTRLYAEQRIRKGRHGVMLDGNTIADESFDIVPSTKIPPENVIHLWLEGQPVGYVMQPDETLSDTLTLPEECIIHFALGGLLGDYKISGRDSEGNIEEYDIKFSEPLMAGAVQPTQTLSLLEDSTILSSLIRTVKFIAVECGNAEEEEIQSTLQTIKDMIEQQLSLNTSTGDAQSFVNPQSPNNLIYLAKVNGTDPVSITDLNMAEASDADNKLLDYYQNKKLSVLGIPKEAMNYSSAEGLGGAGQVMSQRSAFYANCLERIETAYKNGWQDGFNKYFVAHNASGYVDKFQLHMNPIITQMSTVAFDKRDAALSQVQALIDILKNLGVTESSKYVEAIQEVLNEVLPKVSTASASWDIDVSSPEESNEF